MILPSHHVSVLTCVRHVYFTFYLIPLSLADSLSIYPIYLSMYLSIYRSIFLYSYLPIYLSTNLPNYLSIYLCLAHSTLFYFVMFLMNDIYLCLFHRLSDILYLMKWF
jgi:hypothetical protein